MKRTTIYLDPETEVLLKLEAMRRRQPMSEVIRDALRGFLHREPATSPPGGGAFDSGRTGTAARAEEILSETGFGDGR
jgi:hypothetical protein